MSKTIKVRQLSDLVSGTVVSEYDYEYEPPPTKEISDILVLILQACKGLMKSEGIEIVQDSLDLERIVFKYPGVAGEIEVTFSD